MKSLLTIFRVVACGAVIVTLVSCGGGGGSGSNSSNPSTTPSSFAATALVSDGAVPAAHTDANLKNPWGLAFGPTTPLWVADNGTSVATLYGVSPGGATATVTGSGPTGSITFTDSGNSIGVINLSSGAASLTTSSVQILMSSSVFTSISRSRQRSHLRLAIPEPHASRLDEVGAEAGDALVLLDAGLVEQRLCAVGSADGSLGDGVAQRSRPSSRRSHRNRSTRTGPGSF